MPEAIYSIDICKNKKRITNEGASVLETVPKTLLFVCKGTNNYEQEEQKVGKGYNSCRY